MLFRWKIGFSGLVDLLSIREQLENSTCFLRRSGHQLQSSQALRISDRCGMWGDSLAAIGEVQWFGVIPVCYDENECRDGLDAPAIVEL